MSDGGSIKPRSARLAASAGMSPYGRAGAPGPHPNTDPYESLRARALSTLEAMGFDPDTMVEHAVLWAEHQDPFGHVMNAQFVSFMGASWIRVMESYDEFLSAEELDGVMNGKTVAPMVRRFDLEIKRQVKYPDVVIAAYRQEKIEPTRNGGTTVLFSLQQQAIVAQIKGTTTYVDVKTGRPKDIRTLGGGFPALFEEFTKKSERVNALRERWELEHPPKAPREKI
ncbi:hypothetical protein N7533_000023 [Penicillium manginii]|uniref:uncharacterized protein n=1 Tax=Penicillium manginii TaxID=203109 RepID=UPI0025477B95|nr:uncharacterized protein N7533_000023 [Penicillium manginii]KAJ5767440.1 hypothetical protein N7533_000023 [Penicillium manginii]